MTATIGNAEGLLSDDAIRAFVSSRLDRLDLDGRSLCLVIPDATRKCPLPLLLGEVAAAVAGRVRSMVAVVALGTHAPMTDAAMHDMIGTDRLPVVNHEWWDPATFRTVGALDRETVRSRSGGRLDLAVDVRINRLVTDSDVTIIVGPVLPHEVAGFSGGNKYLFPGLSGQELIDVTHWLGALVTSREMIGAPGTTPVRALIDAAAALVPGERYALSAVVEASGEGLHMLSFGDTMSSWAAAAEAVARTHIVHLPAPVQRVLSIVPARYEDLWTGAKGFYKVEPVVADGGEVVLYAPHITEVSAMHPRLLDIGYHCRDYFVSNWDRFEHVGWGELAHSTHLFGAGWYDPGAGERQRVRVVLATRIPKATVERVNLIYRDPASVTVGDWESDPQALVVHDAGEVLYRLAPPARRLG